MLTLGCSVNLLVEANNDKFIRGFITDSMIIYTIGKDQGLLVVDFIEDWVKIAAIWIPSHNRGKNLAFSSIKEIVGNCKSFAFIEKNNTQSKNLLHKLNYNFDGYREKDKIIYELWVKNT